MSLLGEATLFRRVADPETMKRHGAIGESGSPRLSLFTLHWPHTARYVLDKMPPRDSGLRLACLSSPRPDTHVPPPPAAPSTLIVDLSLGVGDLAVPYSRRSVSARADAAPFRLRAPVCQDDMA